MINIFVLLVTLLVIVFVIYKVISKVNLNKFAYWMLGAYIVVLLVSIAVYTLIPTENMSTNDELKGKGIEQNIVNHVAYGNQTIEDYEKYRLKEWTLDTNLDDKVGLYIDNSDYHLPVLIEREQERENIHASLYHIESPVQFRSDYKEKNSADIRLENTNLIISTPLPEYYQYASMLREFPLTQFSESEMYQRSNPNIYSGEYVLYLIVPEKQELVIDPNIYYENIN